MGMFDGLGGIFGNPAPQGDWGEGNPPAGRGGLSGDAMKRMLGNVLNNTTLSFGYGNANATIGTGNSSDSLLKAILARQMANSGGGGGGSSGMAGGTQSRAPVETGGVKNNEPVQSPVYKSPMVPSTMDLGQVGYDPFLTPRISDMGSVGFNPFAK